MNLVNCVLKHISTSASNKRLLSDLDATYIETTRSRISKLSVNLDKETCYGLLHKMKGAAGMMGHLQMQDTLKVYIAYIEQDTITSAQIQMLADLCTSYPLTKASL